MKTSEISISLCAGIGGIILFPIIALLLYTHGIRSSNLWQLVYIMVFVVSPLAAGAVCGFYEKTSWDGKAGHLICSLLLAATIAMSVFAFIRDSDAIMWIIAVLLPAIMNGFFAGLVAGKIKNWKSKPNWSHLLVCWLSGPVWIGLCYAFIVFGNAIFRGPVETGSIAKLVTAAFSLPFGPYTTLAAKLGEWPNAGEFFSVWIAVLITSLMVLPAGWYIITKNRTIAGLMLVLFATAASASFIIGFVQLLNCTE